MRDPKQYKIMHVKTETHGDLVWLKKKTGKAMTDIVGDLAKAAREGMEEKGCTTD